ncbi:hypothetical protein CANCADRAFT_19429, partial [Tortispora caseinolytica NRRL Y-17796]
MDPQAYLQQYGWKPGQGLRSRGLKKPILVAHKTDTRGLGNKKHTHDHWWETLFDSQLKSITSNGESIVKDEKVFKEITRFRSPLYRNFVLGERLLGTVKSDIQYDEAKDLKQSEDSKISKKSRSHNDDKEKLKKTKKLKK